MKKLVAALAGILGLAWLRRQQTPAADPAAELRAKLADRREQEPEPAEPAAPEPTEPQAEPAEPEPQADVAARRSEVHDRARQAMEDLSTPEE